MDLLARLGMALGTWAPAVGGKMAHQDDDQDIAGVLPAYSPQQGNQGLAIPPAPGLPLAAPAGALTGGQPGPTQLPPELIKMLAMQAKVAQNPLFGFGERGQGRDPLAPAITSQREAAQFTDVAKERFSQQQHRRQQMADALYDRARKIRDEALDYPEHEREAVIAPWVPGLVQEYNQVTQGTPGAGLLDPMSMTRLLTSGGGLEKWQAKFGDADPDDIRTYQRLRRSPNPAVAATADTFMDARYKKKKLDLYPLIKEELGKAVPAYTAAKAKRGEGTPALEEIEAEITKYLDSADPAEIKKRYGVSPALLRQTYFEYVASKEGTDYLAKLGVLTGPEDTGLTKTTQGWVEKSASFVQSGKDIRRWRTFPHAERQKYLKEGDALALAHFEQQQDLVKRAQVKAGIEENLAAQATPEVRAKHALLSTLLSTGELEQPPAGSTNEFVNKNAVFVSERQKKGLGELRTARNALDTVNTMADRLIVAKTPAEAFKQGIYLFGGGTTGAVPEAAAYMASSEAVASSLAKSVGPESGVLTTQDVDRWKRAATASLFDTAAAKDIKKAIMDDFYKAVHLGLMKEISGKPGAFSVRKELDKTLERLDNEASATFRRVIPSGMVLFRQGNRIRVERKGVALPAGAEIIHEEKK